MAAIESVTAFSPVQRKMIDIHTHVIYGVDDGSRSPDMSREMIRMAAESGITHLCCTAHARPGHREFSENDYNRNLADLREFVWREDLRIELYTGCEIMYTSRAAETARKGLLPTLGETEYVLLEFMPDTPWGMIQHGIREMGNAGFLILLAHVERYVCLREEFSWLEELKQMGCMLQMNAETVLRSHGMLGDKWAKRALKTGMIDVVASDMHNLSSRKPNMADARQMLKRDFGEKAAKRLTEEVPRRILGIL